MFFTMSQFYIKRHFYYETITLAKKCIKPMNFEKKMLTLHNILIQTGSKRSGILFLLPQILCRLSMYLINREKSQTYNDFKCNCLICCYLYYEAGIEGISLP